MDKGMHHEITSSGEMVREKEWLEDAINSRVKVVFPDSDE